MALPRDRETMLEEIIEKHAERFRDWEDRTWDEGLALYGKSKPQDRLRWYMSQTLAQDMGMVLDVDYREKRKQGLAGPLTVEIQFQQYQENATLLAQAQQEAEEMGSTLPADFPKQVQPPPMMWVQLMGMSGRFMQKVQRDFRHCLDEQAKREGMGAAGGAPAPLSAGPLPGETPRGTLTRGGASIPMGGY